MYVWSFLLVVPKLIYLTNSAHLLTSTIFLCTIVLPSHNAPYSAVPLSSRVTLLKVIPRDMRRMVHREGQRQAPHQRFLQHHHRSTHRTSSSASPALRASQTPHGSGWPMGTHHREHGRESGRTPAQGHALPLDVRDVLGWSSRRVLRGRKRKGTGGARGARRHALRRTSSSVLGGGRPSPSVVIGSCWWSIILDDIS